jgi:hypothetical protein
MFSFIFFLLVFFNRFYLHRLSVAFGRFSFWPWNKKENDCVSKKEVEGVECVRPWPILSAKWFMSRLYKCLKTACFEGFFSLSLSLSVWVDRRRIYIGNGVVAIPWLLAVGIRRYNHVLKLIEDLS